MLSANDLQKYVDDIAALFPGSLADTGVIMFASDIAEFATTQTVKLPYLLGVIPQSNLTGSADALRCVENIELFLAYRIAKQSLTERLQQTESLKDMTRCIFQHIAVQKRTPDSLWYFSDLTKASVVPITVQQMRGVCILIDTLSDL